MADQAIDFRSHVGYLMYALRRPWPEEYVSLDTIRVTFVYFIVNSLDVLGALDEVLTPEDKAGLIAWIYGLQRTRHAVGTCSHEPHFEGFDGSPSCCGGPFSTGHAANTYASLAALVILGDDLSRVDRDAIAASLRHLQSPDGNFKAYSPEAEADVRFIYAALASAELLALDPAADCGVDTARCRRFLARCQAFDGGFGLNPGTESHGGSTYCAAAAWALLEQSEAAPVAVAAAGDADADVPIMADSCCAASDAAAALPVAEPGRVPVCIDQAMLLRWVSLRQRDVGLWDTPNLASDMMSLGLGLGAAGASSSKPAAATAAAASASSAAVGGAASAIAAVAAAARAGNGAGDDDDDDEEEDTPAMRVLLAGPGGMTGRPGKPSDTCYSFWIGGTVALLQRRLLGGGYAVGSAACPDPAALSSFILTCQYSKGGFCKDAEAGPDPMHTYYALAGLSLCAHGYGSGGSAAIDGAAGVAVFATGGASIGAAGSVAAVVRGAERLRPIDPLLSMTTRAVARLRTLQAARGWVKKAA